MYLGTNIILVTNNENIINCISSELVQLRNIDSILIKTYQEALSAVEEEHPQAIILNCQNSMEEPFCLDLIKKIKNITTSPILLLVETYNPYFIKNASKLGISDALTIQYSSSEILMRMVWSLQKNELTQQHEKHKKLLTQLNIIDENSKLKEDLAMTSLSMVYIVVALENEFDIDMSEVSFNSFVTVNDVINYIHENI